LRVVPVLVGGATMPTEAQLPPDLAPLSRREAFTISPTAWSRDVAALADELGVRPPRARRSAVLIASGVVAAIVIVVIILIITHRKNGTTTSDQPPPISTTVPAPGNALTTVLWHDPMTDPTPPTWRTGAGGDQCRQAITSSGYEVETRVANLSCGGTANFHIKSSRSSATRPYKCRADSIR
jgi:hypothetical protein